MLLSPAYPLLNLIDTHADRLQRLADAWLLCGASAFGIATEGGWLALWPPHALTDRTSMSMPIQVERQIVGHLWVFGVEGSWVEARLAADAELLSQWISMETVLDSMTNDLIASQDQLLALVDLTHFTRADFDIQAAFRSLTGEACRLSQADSASAILMMGSAFIAHHPAPVVSDQMLREWVEQSAANGSRQSVNNPARSILPPGYSALVEPISLEDQTVGVLALFKKKASFTAPDKKLVRAICDQIGGQIEHVLLYQEKLQQMQMQTEMQLAKDVQLNLLPQRLPLVRGLDISAGSLPALQVGGDFYDFFERPGEALVFTVGDVSGKGMSAALLMATTRTLMRSKSRSLHRPTPLDILGATHDEAYDDFTHVGMFATAFVGQYDPLERLLYYANAGHSPVVYCPAGGTPFMLEADGPPIGVLPACTCENHVIEFHSGDLLVVATDGFSEAHDPAGNMLGQEGFLDMIVSLAGQSANEIASGLFSLTARFSSGRGQVDDQTVIVVKGL
ncbi:MAG: SpoIIE family protein phosphatase [Anaerolineae bacterium]|nr:SpoIIE family protein phosphatase [Anaerolineae bacterium]